MSERTHGSSCISLLHKSQMNGGQKGIQLPLVARKYLLDTACREAPTCQTIEKYVSFKENKQQ